MVFPKVSFDPKGLTKRYSSVSSPSSVIVRAVQRREQVRVIPKWGGVDWRKEKIQRRANSRS